MGRITKKELESATNSPQVSKIQTKTNVSKLTNSSIVFDKKGNETEVLPKDQVMATKTTTDDGVLYTVRVNRKRDLYNPYDTAYGAESYRLGKIQNLEPFQMLKVNKECFESYIKFLRYGVGHDLVVAQRGI